jgi:hypothetical protein
MKQEERPSHNREYEARGESEMRVAPFQPFLPKPFTYILIEEVSDDGREELVSASANFERRESLAVHIL